MPEWEQWPKGHEEIRTKCAACGEGFTFKWSEVMIEGYKSADKTNEYLIACPKCKALNRYLLGDLLK
jgi:hypothetical protein